MSARRSRALRRLLAAALVAWLDVGVAAAGTPPCLLVVKSDDLPQYDEQIAAFEGATSDCIAGVVTLDGSKEQAERQLHKATAEHRPGAIYALGAKAAYVAKTVMPDTPLVFGMVMGWQRYGIVRGAVTGVAVEMPVDVLFTRFKLMLPTVESVGVIYSMETDPDLIEQAEKAASALGVRLVTEQVRAPDEVAGAYRRMHTEIDALWMVPDPEVVTRDNFAYLTARTRRDGVAFLAFSENFVRAGALLSVAPDYATMGSQAAVLVDRLLATPDAPPAVQPPVGSKLVVNAEIATELGLDLDATMIGMADVIVNLAKSEEVRVR